VFNFCNPGNNRSTIQIIIDILRATFFGVGEKGMRDAEKEQVITKDRNMRKE
jgi:hypothetical protein